MTIMTRYRGDTAPDAGFVKLNDEVLPTSGCTFTLTVDKAKNPKSSVNNLYSLVGEVVDAVTGEIKFPITEQQADKPPGTYYYDIQIIDGTGLKRTIGVDKYIIKQDITK